MILLKKFRRQIDCVNHQLAKSDSNKGNELRSSHNDLPPRWIQWKKNEWKVELKHGLMVYPILKNI